MTTLSTPAEWHAFVIGALVGWWAVSQDDVGPLALCVAYAVGSKEAPPGHLGDLAYETAYFGSGTFIGYAFGHVVR